MIKKIEKVDNLALIRMKKINIVLLSSLLPLVASAQTVFQYRTLPNGSASPNTLLTYIQYVVNWVFTILLILAVVMILVAAFKYLFSGGDPEKIKSANKTLLFAAVAVAVALLAQGVVFVVGQIIGNPIQ